MHFKFRVLPVAAYFFKSAELHEFHQSVAIQAVNASVLRGAAPCAASPICRFIVHASCQIKKRQETENRQEQCVTFHFVSLSLATVVVHYYF